MTEVQSMQGKTCNYVMGPYPLDVWGATGGKNSKDRYIYQNKWNINYFLLF